MMSKCLLREKIGRKDEWMDICIQLNGSQQITICHALSSNIPFLKIAKGIKKGSKYTTTKYDQKVQ